MKPYYSHGGITIYHGDCREIVPDLTGIEAVISDPPYGMNWNPKTTRFSGGNNPSQRGAGRNDRLKIKDDNKPFDPSPWLGYPAVVLWGFHHFASRLPVGSTLVWIKRNDPAFGSFLSDAELAWMKGGCGVYCKRDLSMNGETASRSHPTQKPLPLMAWCMDRANVGVGRTVLDPFMGSGSTLRAAKDTGRKAIGIEIEERYCEIAARRLEQEVLAL